MSSSERLWGIVKDVVLPVDVALGTMFILLTGVLRLFAWGGQTVLNLRHQSRFL